MDKQASLYRQNRKFEILTPSGFQSFSGIIKRTDKALTFFTETKKVTTSYTHKFIVNGQEVVAECVRVGDMLDGESRVLAIEEAGSIDLYDPVNVADGNIYYGNDFVHHNCQFLGSTNTLISGRTLSTLSSVTPIFHNDMGLDIYEAPQKDRQYIITVDTSRGIGGDFSAFTIVDATEMPYKLVGKFKNNSIAPMLFPSAIYKAAMDYNEAYVLIETNDVGGQVADILRSEMEYENLIYTMKEDSHTKVTPGFAKTSTLGVRTTKSVKRQGCFAIKSLIEEQKLLIFDADVIHELSTFKEKAGSYAADDGYFDDLVMTLVMFAWLTTNKYFNDLMNIDVRKKIYAQHMEQIEDEMTPFGVIDDGLEEDEVFVDRNVVWSTAKELPWKDSIRLKR